MKTKKVFAILIAVFFAFSLLFSCVLLFSVKKVDVCYAVGEQTDVSAVEKELNAFTGKNLLFLDSAAVEKCLAAHPYFEITEVKKSYPNVLTVGIKERRETFVAVIGDTAYVTDENGLLLKKTPVSTLTEDRNVIRVNLTGITVVTASLGEKLLTSGDELLYGAFEMAKAVRLGDCIKSVSLTKAPERNLAVFQTYSGVKINVEDANIRGTDKIKAAFSAYDLLDNDYLKLNKVIEVVLDKENGSVIVTWTDKSDN